MSATAWRHSFTLGGRRCPAPTAGTLVAAPGSGAGAEALDDAPAADVAAAADPLAVATSRAEAAVGAALLPEGAAPSPPFLPHPPISATVQSGNASRILCCSLEPDTILRRMSCELQRLNRRAGRLNVLGCRHTCHQAYHDRRPFLRGSPTMATALVAARLRAKLRRRRVRARLGNPRTATEGPQSRHSRTKRSYRPVRTRGFGIRCTRGSSSWW